MLIAVADMDVDETILDSAYNYVKWFKILNKITNVPDE